MTYKTSGNAVAEWDDDEPFLFYISAEIGAKDDRRLTKIKCDLTDLKKGFSDDFLRYLKDFLIERNQKIALRSVDLEYQRFLSLFRKVILHNLFDRKITCIDGPFLLALGTIMDTVPRGSQRVLESAFNANPYSPIFAPHLTIQGFPRVADKKGNYGRQIERILASAFTKNACVAILQRCEDCYENGDIDIGYFSFINLAFSVFARPDSYRRIRLTDLEFSRESNEFFIYIAPAKTGVHKPKKICYRINSQVGVLLQKQRHNVIEQFGHLVDPSDIGKLALFPARRTCDGNSRWLSHYSAANYGELENSGSFNNSYVKLLRTRLKDIPIHLTSNALRHTVGTQLAESGCSAKTIMAVLKHASDSTAQAYVDIVFQGLVNELSEAMQPSFEAHFPAFKTFRSKHESVASDKAIFSDDVFSGMVEMTGECGKEIRCQAAPFTCYECSRFIPCFDADHSVNFNSIQREIDEYENMGSAFRHLVEKAKSIKHRIYIVMTICDHYQHISNSGTSLP